MERIDQEHPEYQGSRLMWQRYRDLYAGGEVMKTAAHAYLNRRSKEPLDVYYERMGHAYYENYVGSIVDWYSATLFRREPLLSFDGGTEWSRGFYSELIEDCDLRGSSLTAFLRKMLTTALVAGRSYVLVDFPSEGNREWLSRAYLVGYHAEELINWGLDELGNLEWCVLRSWVWGEDERGAAKRERVWLYFDKKEYRKYREMGKEPVLVASGEHGLARLNRVPLFELRIPEGLWLMNKAASVQLEHFNKSNALAWALQTGLFAMPIVYSQKPFDQMVGESYFLQLDREDKFGWAEPAGHVHAIAVENLKRLKEEIYRVCFLLSQAGGPLTGTVVSGVAKQREYAVTQEVLRTYGDLVKDLTKNVLRAINLVRGDGLTVDVAGLDEFDIGEFAGELENAKALLEMGIPSETLKKQVWRRLAQNYLCDAQQELKQRVLDEIEEG